MIKGNGEERYRGTAGQTNKPKIILCKEVVRYNKSKSSTMLPAGNIVGAL
jgi:hypothetical protein